MSSEQLLATLIMFYILIFGVIILDIFYRIARYIEAKTEAIKK